VQAIQQASCLYAQEAAAVALHTIRHSVCFDDDPGSDKQQRSLGTSSNFLNDEAIGELVAAMKSAPDAVEAGLSLFSVVRHLERVADHATNIAKDVVSLAEGALIRHRPEVLVD
jgi:phosphate transport system protein